jgi:hypothetical protein
VAVGGKNHGSGKGRRKLRAPWGNILGGKSIVRHTFMFDKRIDFGEDALRLLQYVRMLELKRHYQIQGGDHGFPIKGLAPAPWLPWYQLALAIASDLDDSLKIVGAQSRSKTSRRWRGGLEGMMLLELVEFWKERTNRSIRWCLERIRKLDPDGFGRIPLKTLVARYHEVKRSRSSTK